MKSGIYVTKHILKLKKKAENGNLTATREYKKYIRSLNTTIINGCDSDHYNLNILLELRPDIYTEDEYNFISDAANGRDISVYIKKGINMHLFNDYALEAATINGCYQVVKTLIENGVTPNGNALYISAVRGYLDILSILLVKGKDIYNCDDFNYALFLSVSYKHYDVVELLLKLGIDSPKISESSYLRTYPILEAMADCTNIDDDDLKIIQLLLDNGVDIHAKNDKALRFYAEKDHLNVVELLLKNGANAESCNKLITKWFQQETHTEVIDLLIKYGAKLKKNFRLQNNLKLNQLKPKSSVEIENMSY